jgi:light-regulated signal transduction histidine kinase (bacteriophytochrome)
VADNGIGMDLSKIGNKLFGLYKTFHNRKEIDSKGMGLYMTKMQVESLGGQITVESETDKGTTFTLKLKVGGQSKDT